MLKDRYPKNEDIISRLSTAIQTDKDLENFAGFVADLWEMGFLRAVDNYRTELAKVGYNVKVVPGSQNEVIQTKDK